jgi:hypothetical protein
MTDVLMYDGINSLAAGISRQFPGAAKVAGYLNGIYAWSQAEWGLFPHADHVTISVTASANAGDVLDVETGDATPDQAHGWIAMRKAAGLYRPTIYCSRSVIPAVRAGTGSYVLGKDYDIWVADYDGSAASVYPGTAAKQYLSTPGYDLSVVYDAGWPHRKPPGTPPPVAAPGWPAGLVLRAGDTGAAVTALQEALNATHLPGVRNITVDGSFGPQTVTSVRNFQSLEALAVDGIAGKETRAALGV